MAVPEQTPFIEYTANGTTTVYPLTFDCDKSEYLIVSLDGEEAPVGSWSLAGGSITFNSAPANGVLITIERNTPFRRTTEYQSYDNSFRPSAVNKDFDLIWWKLQELGVANWILNKGLKQEILDRITADEQMLDFILNQDNSLKDDYIERDSKLKDYIDQLIALVTGDPSFDGITSEFVIDGDKSQHEINEEQASKNVQLTELIASSVEVEKQRALLAESTLQTNINTENTRATGAESTLNTKIDNETSRALGVEQSLQLQISTSNAGIKYFQTEAALLATTPGTTDPKQAYAFNTKKNYLWNGTNWIDEGLSQLDQAKAFANANPNFKAASFSNAFDFDLQLTMGQYDVGTSALNGSTHKPPFDVGGILIVEGSGKDYFARQRFCTIDNQEAVRTKKDVWGAWDVVIKAGDLKAKPITAPIDFNTFKKPDTYTITTVILLQCTNRPPVNAGGVFEVKGTGADYLTAHVFRSYDNIDVSRTFKTTWGAWDLHIKASDLKPKVVSSAIDFNAFNLPGPYSITNNVLATCSNGPPTPNGGIFQNIGTGAAYYTHREYVSFKGEFFKQSLETTWGPWKKLATTDITDNLAQQIAAIQIPDNGLTGKKFLAIGDSITFGLNNTNNRSWANILAERYGAVFTKHAFSGAWISKGTGTIAIPNVLSESFANLPDSANFDVIAIAAGTNDRINGVDGNLGTPDDRTNETFYGALHVMLSGLKLKFPNARMLFISQIPRAGLRSNPNNPTDLDRKFKAITDVCDYYSVPVWAGHKNFGFHPDDNATFRSTYMQDGLHPTNAGQIWMANRLEQAILSAAK